MSPLEALERSPLWSQSAFAIFVNLVVFVGFVLIAVAVALDFKHYYKQNRTVVGSDRSLVETGSMTAFFLVYYLAIRFQVLQIDAAGPARMALIWVGLGLVIAGVAFNLYGRVALGSSWANQIRVYEGQSLITGGPYSVVRHPLYASLIWIFIGASLIYLNPLALVLTLGVFLPMMYVRARKEDALLQASFGEEYEVYRRRTGMFFPKVWR